jgi:hypothetical protein
MSYEALSIGCVYWGIGGVGAACNWRRNKPCPFGLERLHLANKRRPAIISLTISYLRTHPGVRPLWVGRCDLVKFKCRRLIPRKCSLCLSVTRVESWHRTARQSGSCRVAREVSRNRPSGELDPCSSTMGTVVTPFPAPESTWILRHHRIRKAGSAIPPYSRAHQIKGRPRKAALQKTLCDTRVTDTLKREGPRRTPAPRSVHTLCPLAEVR